MTEKIALEGGLPVTKILIVDDELDIRQLIQRYAALEGYETTEASDGIEAIELCRKHDFDLIIMDVMLPKLNGFSASKEIRKTKDIPILMLSARGEEYDKLFGFEIGVDDYVVKPFSPKELMARANAIMNRHKCQASQSQENMKKCDMVFGKLRINPVGRNVYVDGQKTELTAKGYDLLSYLAENYGAVLTRDQILNAVWGCEYFGADRTVDWQMKLLRNQLGECRNYIITKRGVGYKFEI